MAPSQPRLIGHGAEQMKIICYAVLTLESRTVVGASLAGSGPRLMYAKAICESDEGLYLFSCDQAWNVMFDSFHDSLDAAKQQAEFEHPGIRSRWVESSKRGT